MTAIVIDCLRWEVRDQGAGQPVLLLHGFTGRGAAWGAYPRLLRTSWRTIVVDLPGHGRTASGEPWRITIERTADDLAEMLERLGASPAAVVGYSLGARVALRLAVAHSEVVARIVLESPSAGIPTAAERIARRDADEALAGRLERDGIEAFVTEWEAQSIFASHASLSGRRAARIRSIRLSNRAEGLAASLRGAGMSRMEPLLDRLAEIGAPTLVVAGALDTIGCARARVIARGIPGARLEIVDGAGHTPHEERPADFRRLILDFLQQEHAA